MKQTIIQALLLISCLGCLGCNSAARAQDFSPLFDRLKPTVVVIEAQKTVMQTVGGMQVDVDQGGLGSGVLISKTQILTAAHVVHTADTVIVHFHNGTEGKAKVVASSPSTDVALLELDKAATGVSSAPLGDSDKAKIGEQVIIIGAPYGLTYTMTSGHLSNRIEVPETTNRLVPLELFQTDAAINQGNSGGPMFNMRGEVIGIVSHILSKSGGFEGLGFATASNVAEKTLISKAGIWTGAQAQLLSGTLCEILNVPQKACFMVTDVAKGSLADKLGLKPSHVKAVIQGEPIELGGDVILSVGGVTIEDMDSLEKIADYIENFKPGSPFMVTVWRDGKRVELRHIPQ